MLHGQGFGIVGGSEDGPLEVEGEHAFSLTLGQLPGVSHRGRMTFNHPCPHGSLSCRVWFCCMQATVRVLHTLRSSIPDGRERRVQAGAA